MRRRNGYSSCRRGQGNRESYANAGRELVVGEERVQASVGGVARGRAKEGRVERRGVVEKEGLGLLLGRVVNVDGRVAVVQAEQELFARIVNGICKGNARAHQHMQKFG